MVGKPIAVAVNDIVEIAKLEIEKLRSWNRLSGTSGSWVLRCCHSTNSANTTRPPTIEAITQAFQWYLWPCWIPKTSRNMPIPLRATPSQSNLCIRISSVGTHRTARTKPMMPTGMLMKKIHSQPSASTRMPPRIGPTRVATPAVAPHSAIAWPRLSAGKIRVITDIVCGVRIPAPRPCSTRAAISISMLVVRPHHSEASVKTVRPTR